MFPSERSRGPHSGWRSRGYLPHYDCAPGTQHIAFRLADALPASVLEKLERAPAQERLDAAEACLDEGVGSRALADRRIAGMVQEALQHFNGDRYELLAWCIMPTHVHVLASQMEGSPLGQVVHAWKSFSANRANDILGRQGRSWAPEYFDRKMRDEDDVEATRAYIEDNPVLAKLCSRANEWAWSSARAEV